MFGLELDTIHPLSIHFPIALLTCAYAFELGGLFLKKVSMSNSAMWCQIAGTLSLIPAIISGFWADESYGHIDDPFPIHETHGSMLILVAVGFSSLLIWRLKGKMKLPPKPLLFVYLGLNGLLVLLMTYGSHLGAILGERI